MNNKNNKKKKWLAPIFLSWIVLSIFGIIHYLTINIFNSIIIFCQLILVLRMFSSKKKENLQLTYSQKREHMITKTIYVIVILIGMSSIILGNLIILLIAFIPIFGGLAMIIIPYINNKKLKKDCTYRITAKIIEYETIRDERSVSYCPIYEFYYKNKAYKVTKNQFSNVGKFKKIGSNVELIINPNEPEQFIDNSDFSKVSFYMGIIFIVGGFFVLYTLIQKILNY